MIEIPNNNNKYKYKYIIINVIFLHFLQCVFSKFDFLKKILISDLGSISFVACRGVLFLCVNYVNLFFSFNFNNLTPRKSTQQNKLFEYQQLTYCKFLHANKISL